MQEHWFIFSQCTPGWRSLGGSRAGKFVSHSEDAGGALLGNNESFEHSTWLGLIDFEPPAARRVAAPCCALRSDARRALEPAPDRRRGFMNNLQSQLAACNPSPPPPPPRASWGTFRPPPSVCASLVGLGCAAAAASERLRISGRQRAALGCRACCLSPSSQALSHARR